MFHKGAIAKSVLELMKSRYSAFAVGNIDYIIKTSTFQKDYNDLKSFSDNCDFKKLEILEYSTYSVTFRATIFCADTNASFIEKSYFILNNGKWFYDKGEIL